MKDTKISDVIIIGAGPAGLQAGIYTARAKLNTLIFGTSNKKSLLDCIPYIGNYLGFPEGISGKELIEKGIAHAKKYGADVRDEEVLEARLCDDKEKPFEIKTSKAIYRSKTIIIATGLGILRAGIKGEATFENKGLSYCVICDGYFFQNKKVAVIGHRDFAAEKVLDLFSYTKDVTLFTQGLQPDMTPAVLEEIQKKGARIIIKKVIEITGTTKVEGLALDDGSTQKIDGVFIGVGTASSLSFAKSLGITAVGNFLSIDHKTCTTNIPGVFAAGDCTGSPLQISKVIGEGAVAALGVIAFLRGGVPIDHAHI